jgi:hypothetical protein
VDAETNWNDHLNVTEESHEFCKTFPKPKEVKKGKRLASKWRWVGSNWCNFGAHDVQGAPQTFVQNKTHTCGMIAQRMRLRVGVCPWGGGVHFKAIDAVLRSSTIARMPVAIQR